MSRTIVWGDEFTRMDPVKRSPLDDQCVENPPVKLTSGRNMFASFQISAGPLEAGESVSVAMGTLQGEKKRASVAAQQADVYVQWYHRLGDSIIPEICVPQDIAGGSTPDFRRMNGIEDQQYAGFWVDVFVPANAKPDLYSGVLKVKIGGSVTEVPVELSVAPATLGHESCLDVSLNNYADAISGAWSDLSANPDRLRTAKYRRVEKGVFRAAHDHRMFLHYLPYGHSGVVRDTFAPPLTGEGPRKRVASWGDWDRHFGGYFDGSAFQGTRRGPHPVKRFYTPLNLCWPADFVKFGEPGYEAEWRAVGRDMAEHFKTKGWSGTRFDMFLNHKQRYRYFPWDTEEARFPADNDLQRYFGTLWNGTFDRATTAPVTFDYTLGTTWLSTQDLRSDLTEFVDVFICNTAGVLESRSVMPSLLRKKRQVWACLNSGHMGQSVRAAVFPPLLMWMVDASGYMPVWCSLGAYGAAGWSAQVGNGGTSLLYSGVQFGCEETFASVRLKVQRNAIQTMDLFQSAAERVKGGKGAVKRKINGKLGIPGSGWYPAKKAGDDDNTEQYTEEPPLAGWENFSVEQYRGLNQLAINMASEGV